MFLLPSFPALWLTTACTTGPVLILTDVGNPDDTDTIPSHHLDSGSDSHPTETGTGDDDTGGDPPPQSSLIAFEDGSPPTNVLMISIDTLRTDFLGRYAMVDDALHNRSPTLDRLLEEGVALDRHRSCSNWTYHSMICALSGRDAIDAGYIPHSSTHGIDLRPLPSKIPILPDFMTAAGYQTALLSTNAWLNSDFNIATRYDHFIVDYGLTAQETFDASMDLLETLKASGSPWLLHVHTLEPHTPYASPEEYILDSELEVLGYSLRTNDGVAHLVERYGGLTEYEQGLMRDYAKQLYSADVAYTDVALGQFLDTLDAAGDLDDTLVVIFSDHGEQLWQRGQLAHGHELHSEEADALGLFWAKDILPAAVSFPTTHRDLLPTLFDVLGIAGAESGWGRVLELDEEDAPVFSTHLIDEFTLQSVDVGMQRLVFRWDGTLEFFELITDPHERRGEFPPDNTDVATLWQILLPEVQELDAYFPYVSPVFPEDLVTTPPVAQSP